MPQMQYGNAVNKDETHSKTSTKHLSAIIVGVLLAGDDNELLNDDLDELESLLITLGIKTNARVIQRRQKLTAKCLLGEGKVDEIRLMAETVGAKLVVFDRPLAPPQVRNLESMTGCEVLDRTGVILEIFARHARTTQAKTQVEIAQLEYLLPRMTGAWTHLQRQRGRGMGEKQIEIDRRRARERIARLQKQLEGIRKERLSQRKARRNELKVAMVGYTNSGKTTVLNALTKANMLAADVLFATLDANVRALDPNTRPKILLSDTVGFIRNLPHGLVESFRSTLDEVLEADLLLHVVDVSRDNYQAQIDATKQVLRDIGAADIPLMMVFNKIDCVDDPMLPKILKQAYKNSICISAMVEADAVRLREHVFSYFENNMVKATLAVPQEDQSALSLVYKSCLILSTDFSDQNRAIFEVRAASPVLAKLDAFRIESA
jgi:GTP-binding protein HflX